MRRLKLLLFAFLIISFISTSAQFTRDDFKNLAPLAGSWKMPVKDGMIYEQWAVINDSLMKGISFKVSADRKVKLEEISLKFEKGSIYYIPVTEKQNQQQPVPFTLVAIEGSSYIFENKAHDFPQRITYKIQGGDSLLATISGNTAKGYREISFPYSSDDSGTRLDDR